MTACGTGTTLPSSTTEDVRIRVGTALSLLELAAQVLEEVPPPETALPLGDRERYRYPLAAETAKCWLLGPEAEDAVDRPARESALGGGQRIYNWTEVETERHFENAVREWSERR